LQAKRGAAGGGMFAVAMTLLFLELRVPVGVASGSPGGLPCSVQLLVCLYAVSGSCCTRFGAAVCVIHTYWSIAFIVLVQRNSPLPFGRKKNQELSLLFS